MKKTIFIFAVAGTSFLASCKKDRTCVCTTTSGTASSSTSTTINDTQKNAKAECEAMSASAGGITKTCELK